MRNGDSRRVRLAIVYPADPLGSIPGGIDSFIRGIIRHAPSDLDVSVVGVTTDGAARPTGAWTECTIGQAAYRHFAVYEIANPRRQPRVPATIRFMAHLARNLPRFRRRFDVLEFHRIEPVALFLGDPAPRTAVLHTNMDAIRSAASSIRWRHLPGLYFLLEGALLPRLSSAFVVGEDAADAYRRRYPDLANRFRFTPTWMDPAVFYPLERLQRAGLRARLLQPHGVRDSDRVLITVGRLEQEKDPLLLAAAFAEVCRARADMRLVLVGDGVLHGRTEALLRSLGVADRVIFTGLLPPTAVAEYLNAADLFVLASAYEGMPMSVLEALGCGLPVCTTDVGAVRRAVVSGVNGQVVELRTPTGLAQGIVDCLDRLDVYRGPPALEAARPFVPQLVLAPLYENYRRLAHEGGESADRGQGAR